MSKITRRDFIKIVSQVLAATGVGVIVAPIVAYFYPSKLEETPAEPVRVGKVDELPENEARVVQYGRYPAIVINTSQGLRAYSAVCTHLACIVKWNKEIGQCDIFCRASRSVSPSAIKSACRFCRQFARSRCAQLMVIPSSHAALHTAW